MVALLSPSIHTWLHCNGVFHSITLYIKNYFKICFYDNDFNLHLGFQQIFSTNNILPIVAYLVFKPGTCYSWDLPGF